MRGPCKVFHIIKHLVLGPGTYVKDKSSWRALNLSAAGATNNGSLDRARPGKAVGSGDIMPQSRPLAAASAALVCGSIASASGVVVQMAGHEGDGKSLIASVPLSLGTTLSTIVSPIASPPSPALSAPDNRQGSAPPANSPQTAPLRAVTPAANSPRTAPVNAATPAANPPRTAPVNAATPAANPPHSAPLDAVTPAVTASTEAATPDQAQQPVPAAKKS